MFEFAIAVYLLVSVLLCVKVKRQMTVTSNTMDAVDFAGLLGIFFFWPVVLAYETWYFFFEAE